MQFIGVKIDYAGENPRRRGEEQHDENKMKEIRMPTMKRSLGDAFIKHT